MRTLAFDGQTGVAGDVVLGALVAAGADPDVLAPVTDVLPVAYEFAAVDEQGVAATRARVVSTDAADDETTTDHEHSHDHDHSHDREHSHDHDDANGHSHDHDHSHSHDHGHSHDHDHSHDEHGHSHEHAEGRGPERTYDEVVALVDEMALPDTVATNAREAFRLLGEAEAAVHDTALGVTPFHEVGADDAIADVVGACLLADDLGPERIVTTPVAAGGGEATFSHGTYPVPVPAVTEIAARADWRLEGGPVERELTTPTGAAILAALAEGVDTLPPLAVETSGYGAGGYDLAPRPNVLRATVGESTPDGDAGEDDASHAHGGHDEESADEHGETGHDDHGSTGDDHYEATTDHGHHSAGDDPHPSTADGLHHDEVTVLETTLDDTTPEVLGSLQTTLLEAGAHDVTVLPTTGKKSRPGHHVQVICEPGDATRLARRLAVETGTLGVRETAARHRWIADRRVETVTLSVDDEDARDGEGIPADETAAGGDTSESEPTTHEVAVKLALTADGTVYDVSAEYDDVLAAARESGVAVRDLRRRAETLARDRLAGETPGDDSRAGHDS
ncbi:nickel insertion protein [Halobaculum sp. MBLA0147]|uniref:LarC family nickel insertion protein n=1 Tax=Halobaculum sp. MBLA0147 TaxID=3079934 RepID=UPI0035232268